MDIVWLLLGSMICTSFVSAFAAWRLRARAWRTAFLRILVAGLLPLAAIVLVLILGHLHWLLSSADPGRGSYSPLAMLLYGFWLVPLLLVSNLTSAYLAGRTA